MCSGVMVRPNREALLHRVSLTLPRDLEAEGRAVGRYAAEAEAGLDPPASFEAHALFAVLEQLDVFDLRLYLNSRCAAQSMIHDHAGVELIPWAQEAW